MKRILESLKEIFPDFDENTFSKDLELGNIPDFDSMNAVVLQLSLESKFKKDLSELPLHQSTKIIDIIQYLKELGIDIEGEEL